MARISRRKALSDALVVGFAIFAIYFGAGNLIFPPYIGASTGPDWPIGLLGLTLAGILLPVLAVTAVANSGGTFKSLAQPIAPWFYIVYNILVMIGVGTLITIPRTSAVAYEIGVRTLVPAADNMVGRFIAVVVFFAIAVFVAFDQGAIADRIGKVLTPLLLAILLTLVTLAVVRPVGEPVPTGLENPFYMAFTEAYQMGDILTGLLCATIFVSAMAQKGYASPKRNIVMVLAASGVGALALFLVYGGLEYLGASGNSHFPADTERTALLVGLIRLLSGSIGTYALAVAVALACLTTAIGLMTVVAGFVEDGTKGKVPYRVALIAVAVVGVFQAMGGVERIVAIAGPIFMAMYPVSILLVILGLSRRLIPNDGVWKGSALLALIVSLYESAAVIADMTGGTLPSWLVSIYQAIPLASAGFGWIVPALVGAIVGGVLWKVMRWPSICKEQDAEFDRRSVAEEEYAERFAEGGLPGVRPERRPESPSTTDAPTPETGDGQRPADRAPKV
ncbi:MAG: branched-chain amino acid transport system II carrier protein [Propionibacteriaceae bacterium]|nr:branched-chain amino acid transport system II carrier protein [Propionibacteriaceae bacterium]